MNRILGRVGTYGADPIRLALGLGLLVAIVSVTAWGVDDLLKGHGLWAVPDAVTVLMLVSLFFGKTLRETTSLLVGAGILLADHYVTDPGQQLGLFAAFTILGTSFVLAYGRRVLLLALWAAACIAWGVLGECADPVLSGITLQFVLPALAFSSALGLALGFVSRRRRQAEADLARLRERRHQERVTLARELHDSVARDLTIITMQAAVLRSTDDPAEQEFSRAAIEDTARSGLDGLKRLLVVLRAEEAVDEAQVVRDPSAESLTSATGEAVRHLAMLGYQVTVSDVPEALAPAAETTAVRVVREGVTNITKHAPTGALCSIDTRLEGPHLVVTVTSETAAGGARVGPRVPSTRLGIESVAERVRLLGGSLTAGPEAGRWILRAHIPLSPPLAGTVGATA